MSAFLRWREDNRVEEIAEEVFPENVFGVVAHAFGRDKVGRPVT